MDYDPERIARYEVTLKRAEQHARQMEEDLDIFEEIQEDIRKLEAYYTSSEWKADYDADEAGILPEGLKRGVLSQDGIDHLLEWYRDLKYRMLDIGSGR